MTVGAELAGHQFDLDALARHFPTGDPRIVVEDGRTYLQASALDHAFQDGGRLVTLASDLLAQLNGHAMLDDSGYRPVKLLNRFVDGPTRTHHVVGDEARTREHVAVVVGTAEARLGALTARIAINGVPVTPTPTGPKRLASAAANSDAHDLFALIGNSGALGWDPLWKALEIIKVAVGGKAALIDIGWVTDDDLDVFGYSANHPDASGVDARHARRPPGGKVPNRIMSIEQGQQLIRDLARRWLDSL